MKVLILSSHTKSLFWFRLDLMIEIAKSGNSVYAVGDEPESLWEDKFREHGIIYRQIFVSRNGTNPVSDLKTKRSIKRVLQEIMPDKIFVYQAKTISYGCKAAAELGIADVYPMVAGLGSIFRGDGIKNIILRLIVKFLYKSAFKSSRYVFFQNNDDKTELLKQGVVDEQKIVLVPGSGVNLSKFTEAALPKVLTFLYIGRLIKDKGVLEYLNAAREIKLLYGPNVRCLLVGPFDTNPSALNENDIKPYLQVGIEYFGEQTDVRPYLRDCSVFVLPSYHEGTPKTILEAMATCRPIITTDAPGCRETVQDAVNGFLVPVKNSEAVLEKMKYFAENPDVINHMSSESRRIAEDRFDVKIVNRIILSTMGLDI